MVKVGVIGLGVGEAHARALHAREDVEVLALCDFNSERLNQFKSDFPNAELTTEATEILDNPSIDVVCIASFDNFHKEQVIRALDNGKHVFVEKPLCLSIEEAEALREAHERNPSLLFSSNLILRESPRFIDLKQRMNSGALGALSYIEGDYNYGRINKITEGWRGEIPFYSVVLGGGLHLIDLILWLTGDRVSSVSAMGNNVLSKGSQYKYNDLVVALLNFESGLVAKVASNYGCVHPHFHVLNIYGEKATFKNGLEAAELYTSRDPEASPERISSEYPGVHKGALAENFIDAVNGKAQLRLSTEQMFEALSVGLSIEEAMNKQKVVPITYFY